MARYWKAFETQEQRKTWEDEMKAKEPDFVVCMHYPARQLEKELYMPKGQLEPNKYCTVYGFRSTM